MRACVRCILASAVSHARLGHRPALPVRLCRHHARLGSAGRGSRPRACSRSARCSPPRWVVGLPTASPRSTSRWPPRSWRRRARRRSSGQAARRRSSSACSSSASASPPPAPPSRSSCCAGSGATTGAGSSPGKFTGQALGMAVGAFVAGYVVDLDRTDGMWPAFAAAGGRLPPLRLPARRPAPAAGVCRSAGRGRCPHLPGGVGTASPREALRASGRSRHCAGPRSSR